MILIFLRSNENNDRMNKCIFKQNNEIKCSGMIKSCQINRVWGEWPCMQHAHAWWTGQEDGEAGGYASSSSSSFLFADSVKLTRERRAGVCVCFVRSNWQGCAEVLDDSPICEQVVHCRRQLKRCFFSLFRGVFAVRVRSAGVVCRVRLEGVGSFAEVLWKVEFSSRKLQSCLFDEEAGVRGEVEGSMSATETLGGGWFSSSGSCGIVQLTRGTSGVWCKKSVEVYSTVEKKRSGSRTAPWRAAVCIGRREVVHMIGSEQEWASTVHLSLKWNS
jgi:hypothetical protein